MIRRAEQNAGDLDDDFDESLWLFYEMCFEP